MSFLLHKYRQILNRDLQELRPDTHTLDFSSYKPWAKGSLRELAKDDEREIEQKLDELVNLYLDGDIPKENYLVKKNELLKQKVSLAQKMDSARAEKKNWVGEFTKIHLTIG
jgi:hypothetical protein